MTDDKAQSNRRPGFLDGVQARRDVASRGRRQPCRAFPRAWDQAQKPLRLAQGLAQRRARGAEPQARQEAGLGRAAAGYPAGGPARSCGEAGRGGRGRWPAPRSASANSSARSGASRWASIFFAKPCRPRTRRRRKSPPRPALRDHRSHEPRAPPARRNRRAVSLRPGEGAARGILPGAPKRRLRRKPT